MREYYLIKVIYKNKNLFLIWYSENEDSFLISGQKPLTFANYDEAKLFAEKQSISLQPEITVYDFSDTIELISKIEFSPNCRSLINAWHFFSDLAKSTNEVFIGDYDEELIINIYNKLFYGSNLNVLKKNDEEYHPKFNNKEKQKCISIFLSGLTILDKQIDSFYN